MTFCKYVYKEFFFTKLLITKLCATIFLIWLKIEFLKCKYTSNYRICFTTNLKWHAYGIHVCIKKGAQALLVLFLYRTHIQMLEMTSYIDVIGKINQFTHLISAISKLLFPKCWTFLIKYIYQLWTQNINTKFYIAFLVNGN